MSTQVTAGITTSAPGKLFVLGEYAVLHGAPAVLAAVDARARVNLWAAADNQWRIDAPDIGIHQVTLEARGALPKKLNAAQRRGLRVFDAVRATLSATTRLPPLHIAIDTAGFAGTAGKLGIGSSAAVAVALTGALGRAARFSSNPDDLLEHAIQAHRRAQNGEGSGADVATCMLGGVVTFTRDRAPLCTHWPRGLYALAVPTGDGADTPTLVGATRQLAKTNRARHAACIEPLARLAHSGARALAETDITGLLAIADAYFDGLATLGDAAGAPIVTATHQRLRGIARSCGAVFKPTGAGGGDLGLVLTDSSAALRRCAAALEQAGQPPVALGFGAAGLQS